jgi:glycyl-tRNA synthetase beta chain
MSELVVEIFSEEIPARMQKQAEQDFLNLMSVNLEKAGVHVNLPKAFVGPRRLVFTADVSKTTQAVTEERRGPKLGAPDQAISGFLKSTGFNLSDLEQRDGYYYANIITPAKQLQEIFTDVLETVIRQFPWPKSMRYPGAAHTWIRPIQNVMAIFDGKPLVGHLPSCGKDLNNLTYGHRFIDENKELTITSFDDYCSKLETHHVVLNHDDRRNLIGKLLEEYGQKNNLTIVKDDALLTEVAGLVESPILLVGNINPKFMHLPACVLTTSMRVHQKYFAFENDGKLAPCFGVIANHKTQDPNIMLQGFERVLRARLEDALFFYDQDRKNDLMDHLPKLDNIVFQDKLGSLGDKIRRVSTMLTHDNEKIAIQLAKCDLTTNMVGEFPELQGIMGEIYAGQKYSSDIAKAIPEHYKPLGPSDTVPSDPISKKLALLDKIDTLIGFFGVGLKPTGSKDPYALRRSALGVIRLILENKDHINLIEILDKGIESYKNQGVSLLDKTRDDVFSFMLDRFEVYLKSQNISVDIVRGVLDVIDVSAVVDLYLIKLRADAVSAFLQTPSGKLLKAAHKRATGILSDYKSVADVKENLLVEVAEKKLYTVLQSEKAVIENFLAQMKFQNAMESLVSIEAEINAFFASVMVNVDDDNVKSNRLNLLHDFVNVTHKIINLSFVEV